MWITVPNGGRIDIDAFKDLTREELDNTFPYYTKEQKDFIYDYRRVQKKNNRGKREPDTLGGGDS